MSWIAFDVDLPDKPKVRQMARTLGLDRDAVAGKLARVWGWFDRASEDGFIAGAVDADIDDLTRQDGFASAMCLVGWLVIDASGLRIPEFEVHHGNSAKKRALGALRQQRYRSRKSNAENVTDNAGDVTEPSTSVQEGDANVTLEASPQNIREENKKKEREQRARDDDGDEQEPANSPPPNEPTPAGLACKAIMAHGIQANPSHPDLLAAIAEGATAQEFSDAAEEAKRKHKGFPWLLATVRGRKRDCATPSQQQATPKRYNTAEDTQREMASIRRARVTETPTAFSELAKKMGVA